MSKKDDLSNLFHNYNADELEANPEIVKNMDVKKEVSEKQIKVVSDELESSKIKQVETSDLSNLIIKKESKEYKTIYFNKSTLTKLNKIRKLTNRNAGDVIDLALTELEKNFFYNNLNKF